MLTNSVIKYIGILMISETKFDETFLHVLYHLMEFSNYQFSLRWNIVLAKR